jgi:hypothetical protein
MCIIDQRQRCCCVKHPPPEHLKYKEGAADVFIVVPVGNGMWAWSEHSPVFFTRGFSGSLTEVSCPSCEHWRITGCASGTPVFFHNLYTYRIEVCYSVHERTPVDTIVSRMNPLTLCLKSRLIISSNLRQGLPRYYAVFISYVYATCLAHLILLDVADLICDKGMNYNFFPCKFPQIFFSPLCSYLGQVAKFHVHIKHRIVL